MATEDVILWITIIIVIIWGIVIAAMYITETGLFTKFSHPATLDPKFHQPYGKQVFRGHFAAGSSAPPDQTSAKYNTDGTFNASLYASDLANYTKNPPQWICDSPAKATPPSGGPAQNICLDQDGNPPTGYTVVTS